LCQQNKRKHSDRPCPTRRDKSWGCCQALLTDIVQVIYFEICTNSLSQTLAGIVAVTRDKQVELPATRLFSMQSLKQDQSKTAGLCVCLHTDRVRKALKAAAPEWTSKQIHFVAGRRGAVMEVNFYNKLERLNVQAGKRDNEMSLVMSNRAGRQPPR